MISDFLSKLHMINVFHMKLSLYPLTCKKYYMLSITTYMKLNRKNIYLNLDDKQRLVVQFCQKHMLLTNV